MNNLPKIANNFSVRLDELNSILGRLDDWHKTMSEEPLPTAADHELAYLRNWLLEIHADMADQAKDLHDHLGTCPSFPPRRDYPSFNGLPDWMK